MTNATIEQWRQWTGYRGPLTVAHHVEILQWEREQNAVHEHDCAIAVNARHGCSCGAGVDGTTKGEGMKDYAEFIERKTQVGADHGFDPVWMPEKLFDFQVALTTWALRKGRAAVFADCGL